MKKHFHSAFLFPFLFFLSYFSFAQTIPNIENIAKAKLSKWSIGVQINTVDKLPPFTMFSDNNPLFHGGDIRGGDKKNNSYSLGLIINYIFKENISIRIKTGITRINMSNYYELPYLHDGTDDISLKQTTTNYIPGIEWNIVKGKINFYTGFEAPINIYGKYNYKANDRSINNGMPSTTIITTKIDGGLSAGIGSFLGVRIHLFKNIFIGSEFSYSLLYSKIGGNETYEQIDIDDASGTVFNHNIYTFRESIAGVGLSGFKASLNISYLF